MLNAIFDITNGIPMITLVMAFTQLSVLYVGYAGWLSGKANEDSVCITVVSLFMSLAILILYNYHIHFHFAIRPIGDFTALACYLIRPFLVIIWVLAFITRYDSHQMMKGNQWLCNILSR